MTWNDRVVINDWHEVMEVRGQNKPGRRDEKSRDPS